MAIGPFLRFFSGAVKYARTDLSTFAESEVQASRLRKQQRAVVIGGIVGGFIGLVFGILAAVSLVIQPHHGGLHGSDVGLIPFSAIVMIALGIVGGAGWVCAFLPTSFFQSPAGALWLRMVGTTNLGVARFMSVLAGLVGIGACIGLLICIATGHV